MTDRIAHLVADDPRARLGAVEALVIAIDVERGAEALGFFADLLDGTNPRLARALDFHGSWPDGAEEARRWARRLEDAARVLRGETQAA